MLLSPERLSLEIEALAAGEYLADPAGLVFEAAALFRLPEQISTVDCAEQYRKLPGVEDGAVVPYDRWRTPYNIGPMNSLDDPRCRLMVMVKPSRSGGTTVAENHLFKRALFGPTGHVTWVLNSDEAVTAYCKNIVKPMFDLNEDLQARIDPGTGNDTDAFKRIGGYPFEWLSAKDSTFRNREPVFMVSDETDAWTKRFAATPKTQIEARQKQLGHRGKGAIMSHPDLGWNSGVANCFEDSSRGIFVMQCPECDLFAAAYATKFWPDVPQFRLGWTKSEAASNDDRLDLAERTAGMICPHCGSHLDDEQRRAMIDEAARREGDGWMHRGQTLDVVEGIIGEIAGHTTHGYWVHGLMLKTEAAGKLARDYEAALIKYERSKNVDQLREFLSKALGEVFEGKAGLGGINAASLQQRAKDSEHRFEIGECPGEVKFITAAVDVGGAKFDVSFRGWDDEGRSWWLDRLVLRQRRWPDGEERDLRPRERIEDWDVLTDRVLLRRFPIIGRPGFELPVAQVTIDVSDGNVTRIGREYAARTVAQGLFWGRRDQPWAVAQLVQGSPNAKAPELPPEPRLKDAKGRKFPKGVQEWSLGVHKLKELALERLAVVDGGPGQCRFAHGIAKNHFDEYFAEPLIDGKFVRQGPNESLDLFAYEEAARLMLNPARKDIDWNTDRLPIWARPVATEPEGGDQPPAGAEATRQSRLDRFARLNKR